MTFARKLMKRLIVYVIFERIQNTASHILSELNYEERVIILNN